MIDTDYIHADLELKRTATVPAEDKPRFDWSRTAELDDISPPSRVKVEVGEQHRDFDIGLVAETIGAAVTDLMLSRKQDEIFTESNRQLVATISRSVAEELVSRAESHGDPVFTLSPNDVTHSIERALIKHNAHDVAKSLVMRRHSELVETMKNRLSGIFVLH